MTRHDDRSAPRAGAVWFLLVLASASVLVVGCSTGQPQVSATPPATPAQATTAPSVGTSAAPSAAPSQGGPAVTFDPSMLGVPGSTPDVGTIGTETADGVTTDDITFSRQGVAATPAYLVHPAKPGSRAAPAIVWFHWLESGAPTSNRTEFLAEARSLARKGVVSLLVQGTFPWTDQPTSLDHDLAAVAAEVRMLRAGVDLVAADRDVDASRIALVGHDFGGMYASVLFGSDARPAALVTMAPTARWADWFLRYWRHADSREAYLSTMTPVDPVTALESAGGRPILLQFGTKDQYVPATVAGELSKAAGASGETRTYDIGHELDDAARADRDGWLAAQLKFG